MKPSAIHFVRTLCASMLALTLPAAAQQRTQNQESLKQEAAMAIRRGVAFLEKAQAANGAIGDAEQPAITGLAAAACLGGA